MKVCYSKGILFRLNSLNWETCFHVFSGSGFYERFSISLKPKHKATVHPWGTDLRSDDPPEVRRDQRLPWRHPAWADTCAGQLGVVNSRGPAFHTEQSVNGHFFPTKAEECICRIESNHTIKQQHRSAKPKTKAHSHCVSIWCAITVSHLWLNHWYACILWFTDDLKHDW